MRVITLQCTCSKCYEWTECVGVPMWVNLNEGGHNMWFCRKCVLKVKFENKKDILESCGWRKIPHSEEVEMRDTVTVNGSEDIFP